MALPEEACAAPEIRQRVTDWLAEHPDFTPPHGGPSRARWNQLVGTHGV
ncbi:hypothetical protein [Nocardia higoensis]|nr:hypothetical protein [Nocardia higoensis]